MKKAFFRALSLLLLGAVCLGLCAGCGRRQSQDRVPLVAGCTGLSGAFSPFYGNRADGEVTAVTQQSLLTTDRAGQVVWNAIEGETRNYQGVDYTYTGIADLKRSYDPEQDQTTYTWTLRKDVRFSDGKKMTADDIIFSYYVLLDPAYKGQSALSALPIQGLNQYLTQSSQAVYDKYSTLVGDIYTAGRDAAEDEMARWYWDVSVKEAWMDHCQALVDYCLENYGDMSWEIMGCSLEELQESESLRVLFGMVLWGLAELEGEVATGLVSGQQWRAEESSLEHYYQETMLAYDGDPESFFAVEATGEERVSVLTAAKRAFIAHWGPLDPEQNGEAVTSISGIQKLDKYSVSVCLEGNVPDGAYALGIQVAPLHYYGDEKAYDYEKGAYGHPFGDLSGVESKSAAPLGAGPYSFVKYENGIVYLEANRHYWRGEPLTYYLEFKDMPASALLGGIQDGDIDIAAPAFSGETASALIAMNPEGSLSGSVAALQRVDLLSCAYVGLNAGTINVGGNPSSEASRNLRKGFATLLAACRAPALEGSLGARAELLEYPISRSCWAAPYPGETGYQAAYSRDRAGKALYTDDMTQSARLEAAKAAAVDFLQAAGFVLNESSGQFSAAPNGAKLDYEFLLPAGSEAGSAARLLAEDFKAVMASLGFEIQIREESLEEPMAQRLETGSQEIWFAIRSAGTEPDLQALYHSTNIPGRSGSGSNVFAIETAELDALLAEGESGSDPAARKQAYWAAMDIVLDWGVEVPFYQAQGCYVFSAQRVKLESLSPALGSFWGWMNDIENLEMYVD